jgi:hypothetical protein
MSMWRPDPCKGEPCGNTCTGYACGRSSRILTCTSGGSWPGSLATSPRTGHSRLFDESPDRQRLRVPGFNELAGTSLFADIGVPWTAPALESWTSKLLASPVVGRPGDFRPLCWTTRGCISIATGDTERQLVDDLRRRAAGNAPGVDETRLQDGLRRLFPRRPPSTEEDRVDCDWQKIAAAAAVLKRLCVITGGPGTGKTAIVTRVLGLLVEQAASQRPRIALAAPTGKAAMRLQEAVNSPQWRQALEPAVRALIPDHASTSKKTSGQSMHRPHASSGWSKTCTRR